MRGWRGIAVGYLGLVAAYTLFSIRGANATAGLAHDALELINRVMDPNIAGIRDRSGAKFQNDLDKGVGGSGGGASVGTGGQGSGRTPQIPHLPENLDPGFGGVGGGLNPP